MTLEPSPHFLRNALTLLFVLAGYVSPGWAGLASGLAASETSIRRTPAASLAADDRTPLAPGAGNDGFPDSDPRSTRSGFSLGENVSASVTAELALRYDDNIFLTRSDEVSDTILSATPGVEFRFGQNSISQGLFTYKEAFTRYLDKTAPDVNLGSADARFGYDNGHLAVAAAGSFQQLNQNNSAVADLGENTIFRRDVLALSTSAESRLTAKTSALAGVDYNRSYYKTGGLVGSQETSFPLKAFFEVTPKVNLSTGLSYRQVKPQNGGPTGRDWDYNVGARGSFSPKLSGQIFVGYQTRRVGDNPQENLWGFDGAFDYEITPNSAASLIVTRDFSIGARGESLQSSAYSIKLSSTPLLQWRFAAVATHRNVEYGPIVFAQNGPAPSIDRDDRFWEGTLLATYLHSDRISATSAVTLRDNHSTLPAARFSNFTFSVMLGWRY